MDLEGPQRNQDSFEKGESWRIHMTWFENLMQSHGQSSVAPQQRRGPEAKSYLCDFEFSTTQSVVMLAGFPHKKGEAEFLPHTLYKN